MDRIRVYTGGVASCNGYLFKTRDNTYVAVDAPSGFADWIYSKKPDIIITDLLITHQHFDHVEDACRMRQIFDCRIHAGQPYNESLTLEKMARDAWGLPLNVQPFVVDYSGHSHGELGRSVVASPPGARPFSGQHCLRFAG